LKRKEIFGPAKGCLLLGPKKASIKLFSGVENSKKCYKNLELSLLEKCGKNPG
jgi:hypothetical protein